MNLWLALGAALGASWGPPVPLDALTDARGALVLSPGEAARLVVSPAGAAISAIDAEGRPVELRGAPDGALIPTDDRRRELWIHLPEGAEARVRLIEDPGAVARADQGLAEAPTRQDASRRLRAAALRDPAVVALGEAADLSQTLPLRRATHRAAPPRAGLPGPEGAWSTELEGPGVAVLAVLPGVSSGVARLQLQPRLDGAPRPGWEIATTGEAPRTLRLWIPPGTHTLELGASAPAVVSVQLWQERPRRLRPTPAPGPADPLAEAERAWLVGDPALGLEGFRAALSEPGPRGELARARLVAGTPDPAELAALAVFPDGISPDGAELLAEAILRRAALLPDEVVLEAVARARDPELDRLAAWLDGRAGSRAAGLALLRAAATDAPGPALHPTRHASAHTSWRALTPRVPALEPEAVAAAGSWVEALDAAGTLRRGEDAIGVTRARLVAGDVVRLDAPTPAGGRFPLLRLDAEAGARFALDGQPWRAERAHRLETALTPGPHTLEIQSGALVLLDPEWLPEGGGAPVIDARSFPLPARWPLPDAGVEAELRVRVWGAVGPMRATFDDGAVQSFEPDAEGLATLRAGPYARELWIEGPEGAEISLAIRAPRAPELAPAPIPPSTEDALAQLEAQSRQLDVARQQGQGAAELRLARARLLGGLGQTGLARRDAAVVRTERDGPVAEADRREAARLHAALAPTIPTRARLGPANDAAALLALGLDIDAPTEPVARAELLLDLALDPKGAWGLPEAHGLWPLVVEASLAAGRAEQAARAAQESGDPTLVEQVIATLTWEPLTRAESSAGLVPVVAGPAPLDPEAPLPVRAREAMLAAPWGPDEAVVVRGASRVVARLRGERVVVSLFCRDERGPGQPCAVELRLDGAPTKVTVPEGGAPVAVPLRGRPGAHELEVLGPGPGQALVVRTEVDGALLPPGAGQTALRAAPGRPVVLRLSGDRAALRVAPVRGSATVQVDRLLGGEPHRVEVPAGGEALVALSRDDLTRVTISGDADVLLALGRPGPDQPPTFGAELRPEPPVNPRPDTTAALLDALSTPAEPRLPEVGGAVSLELGARLQREALYAPTEVWHSAELSARALRAQGDDGAWLELWTRGLAPSAGLASERWRTTPWGALEASVEAAISRGVADVGGHAGGRLEARLDRPTGPDGELQLHAAATAAWSSDEPAGRVDPRAWTAWQAQHPLSVTLAAEQVWLPGRDLRLKGGLSASTNTRPWPAPLDRALATAQADLLIGADTVLSASVRAGWRFADLHRAEGGPTARLTLEAEHSPWLDDGRRLSLNAGLRLDPDPDALRTVGVAGWLGATLLLSEGRGLRDLPPDELVFRSLREQP